jgi:8-oxo-dGTP pyrophosphatase MutT (NUDIX family)
MPDTMSEPFSFEPPDEPAPIRDAATVIVLREGERGPEALLLRRHGRSGFAADAWVFPGGVVDEADADLDPKRRRGADLEALAPRFNATPRRTLALHAAAVRETFEESGLLLATHADGSPVDAASGEVAAMRTRLADRDDPAGAAEFHRWLERHDLVLELGRLAYWARWITPRWEKRRYDTRFFLARAPEGQVAAFDDVEVTGQHWLTPAEALGRAKSGELHMIYPTIKNLEDLDDACGRADLDAVFAHASAHEVHTVLPHFERTEDGGFRVLHPQDPGYPRERYAAELAR